VFDDQTHTAHEFRAGMTGMYPLAKSTQLRGSAEVVHRLDDNGAGLSGQVIGLFPFAFQGQGIQQTWGRVGAEVDQRLTDSSMVSTSVSAATNGEDPDYSAAVSLKMMF
jgi:hypothetical protein